MYSIWNHFTKRSGNVWHMISSKTLEVEFKNVSKDSCKFAWLKGEMKDIAIYLETRKSYETRGGLVGCLFAFLIQ